MRAAAGAVTPSAATRRQISVLVVGGTSLAILFAMLLLRVSMAAVTVGIVLAGAAVATVAWPEVGLAALILNAVVGLSHAAELPKLGPLTVPLAFEAILAVAFGVQVAVARRRLFLGSPQHLLLGLLTLWIVVSLLVNGSVEEENLDAIRNLYLARVFLFFLLTNILDTPAALQRLVAVLAASNVGLVLASLATRAGLFGEEKMVVTAEKMLRTSGLVHNPNTLAFELTTMLILAVFTAFWVERRWLKAALIALALADTAVILSTLSRSGFVSLVAVVVFMFFKLTRSKRVVAVVLLAAVFLGLAAQSDLVKRFAKIEDVRGVDRIALARVGLNAAVENPVFGVGLGNFRREYRRYNDQDVKGPGPTHNMYMDLASQMGFTALAIYLLVIGITWRRLIAMERELTEEGRQASFEDVFGLAVQCFLVNLCVFGMSGDVEFEYGVFIMVGLAILLLREHERSRPAAGPAPAGEAP